jgi:sporulation protein YabP
MQNEHSVASLNHNVSITDRKGLVISGVKKIESFDNEEFLLETTMGYIIIKGNELEIIKLDTYQGNISIKGHVNSLTYVDNKTKHETHESVFNKLFK